MTPGELLQLNIVNAALGVATLICIFAVAWGVWAEVAVWLRARAAAADRHAFRVSELGLTMADGGEHVKDEEAEHEKYEL